MPLLMREIPPFFDSSVPCIHGVFAMRGDPDTHCTLLHPIVT